MRGIFHWLDRYIQKAEAALLIGSVLLIALNSIANVLGRYLFSHSLYFSEELNYFLIIAVTFIGCSYAARQSRQPGETAPTAAFPALVRNLQDLVQHGGRIDISNVSASLSQGEWRLSLKAELPTDTDDDQFSWPGVLLRTNASVETRISATLFDYLVSINPQLRSALATGMLRKDGDAYEMLANLENGRLTVNGAPLQLPLGLPR
mgnify:CR=1 FL=1